MAGCCGKESAHENLGRKNVCCTDIVFLVIFIAFWAGLLYIAKFSYENGDPYRFLYGFDSFGNTCGKDNTENPIENVTNSGMNTEGKEHVFFMNVFDPDFSMEICVSQCPDDLLITPFDVKDFFNRTGSKLCEYSIDPEDYTDFSLYNSEGEGPCPSLPILPTIQLLHRCVPVIDPRFLNDTETLGDIVMFINDKVDVIRKSLADFYLAWKEIIGLCFVAVGLSFVMLLIMKYFAAVIIYVTIIAASVSSILASGILWWTWYDLRQDRMKAEEKIGVPLIDIDNETAFLSFSIAMTVFTILLLLIIKVLLKRIRLVIALFGEAGKCLKALPLLLLTSLFVLPLIIGFVAAWLIVFAFINTLDTAVPSYEKSFVEVDYVPIWELDYFFWYYIVGGIWMLEFLIAAQQFVIVSAVAMWYFTRNKPTTPCNCIVCQATARLILHHIGTIAFGSFVITLVKIPRYILMYIHSQLKDSTSVMAQCVLKALICCLWILEKLLKYLNKNAYVITAVEGKSFCPAAVKAFTILVSNALRVATLNSVGTFIFILAKIAVVASTAAIGVLWFRMIDGLYFYGIPVAVVSIVCFFIAHEFLSVFETICDCLLLCFCLDCEINDGTPGKEYYMSTALMGFVETSSHRLDVIDGKVVRSEETTPETTSVSYASTDEPEKFLEPPPAYDKSAVLTHITRHAGLYSQGTSVDEGRYYEDYEYGSAVDYRDYMDYEYYDYYGTPVDRFMSQRNLTNTLQMESASPSVSPSTSNSVSNQEPSQEEPN